MKPYRCVRATVYKFKTHFRSLSAQQLYAFLVEAISKFVGGFKLICLIDLVLNGLLGLSDLAVCV